MSSTLTVRTDDALREALQERAASQGKSISSLIREILRDAVKEKPVASRAGHLKGTLELPVDDGDPWREQLRARNWRP